MRKIINFIIFAAVTITISHVVTATPAFEPLQPAKECKSCHASIYTQWQQSWMAQSWSNPLFQSEYNQWLSYTTSQGKPDRSCLQCHAPVSQFNKDWDVKKPLTQEGVTCDICHRVAKVNITGENRYHLVFDPRANIKYGTKNISSDKHQVKSSAPIQDMSLCAGCHLRILDNGTPLERTFKEWQNSSYAKNGISCVDCHMRRRDKEGNKFSHRFPGGKSNSPLLANAATLEIKNPKPGDNLSISVTNTNVGHHFPTGGAHPSRLLLEVSVTETKTKQVIFNDQRTYETPDSARIHGTPQKDSTLAPNETRMENFSFKFPTHSVQVDAHLTYYFVPTFVQQTLQAEYYEKYYSPVQIDHIQIYFPAKLR